MMILLCGIVGSDKDAFVNTVTKQAIVVSGDAIVRMVHGGDFGLYRKENQPIYSHIERAIIIASLDAGRDVVVDRPCLKVDTRKRYIEIAKWFESPIMAVTFPRVSPLEHAEKRFQTRPDGHSLAEWIEVASRQHTEWQEPNLSEGLDNIVPVEVAIEMAMDGKL